MKSRRRMCDSAKPQFYRERRRLGIEVATLPLPQQRRLPQLALLGPGDAT
jgi:hypothetical protein